MMLKSGNHDRIPLGRFRELMFLLPVMAASIWMYRQAYHCFFVQDDFAWLVLSRFHSLSDWTRCFIKFNPAGTYRPLSQETYFWLSQKIFGMWPAGFHILGMAAHLVAVWLLFRLLCRLGSPLGALVGVFVYGVHSAHAIALFWISAFPELLAIVFLLSSVLAFIEFDGTRNRKAYVLSLLAMLLGMMSKESILILPLILAAYCILWSRSRLPYTIIHFAFSGIYALFRIVCQVQWSPYDLSFGVRTLQSLSAYLSWMSGFSDSLLQSTLGWKLNASYPWIAAGFAVLLALLVMFSHNKKAAFFGLLWIAFALQPVLYFSNHSYPYYLAPALLGFSVMLGAAVPKMEGTITWKRNLLAIGAAASFAWLSYVTIKPAGDWWYQRTRTRQELSGWLQAINRQVPDGATAYIVGLKQGNFDRLENGGIFKAFGLPIRKFAFLLPDLDPDLPVALHNLAAGGNLNRAYCFVLSEDKMIDQTEAFRANPLKIVPQHPVKFDEISGITLEVKPRTIFRGKDKMTIKLVNMNAPAIDLLYTLDGQLMPPVLHWQLDANHSASVFADITTPEGEYHFLAIRCSGPENAPWIKISTFATVR